MACSSLNCLLLTRKKPFAYRSDAGDGIVSYFVSLLAQGRLLEIMDPQVIDEEDGEIQEVAALAAMCTKLKGEDRPAMREVEMTLENLLVKKKHVPCDTSLKVHGDEEIVIRWMSNEQVSTETSSRQYTMEEDTLLSGR